MRRLYSSLALIALVTPPVWIFAATQQPPGPAAPAVRPPAGAQTPAEAGIPVTDPEVVKACGGCHVPDEQRQMTRISFRRATPENWELTIRRMMSLNNVALTPEVARRVVKSLSDSHGLAPEEARPVMFEAERRLIDYTYEGDSETHELCSRCHSIGRVLNERRTRDEWSGLLAMHRYYYPGIDGISGGFRRGGGPGARGGGQAAAPADTRQPYERAQEHLAKTFPLVSKEWIAWSAAMRTPRLAGRWALAGYEIGKGPVYGYVTIAERPGVADGFTTEATFTYSRTGRTVTRKSRAVVYTGFQWRGRSADTPNDPGEWKEVALIERNGQEIRGRWFSGGYDETGIDVTLRRIANDPVVTGVDIVSLRSPSVGQRLRIYGANLPERVAPGDIDFGQGVRVARVVSATADAITIEVDVAVDARQGPRDLSLHGSTAPGALVVYATINAIKVIPQAGMARLGGVTMPKRVEQFEARGVSYGPDGKPGTPDDLDLGPVDVRWTLEEYTATFRDDDVRFVGELRQDGLFVPAVEGPNPARSGNRNNIGDVWVVATYSRPDGSPSGESLRARAHLLVTVPVYMNWNPREVGR